MKRFISCLVVLAILSSLCVPVMASDGKVEISFCVGDDTLIINGSPVTVEKPYVVGEGVTLVPVRVITEAFDAKVDWIDETQTVKLTYPDVNIVIQIDNPVAEVNGRAEKLLAAPQLTESGYTMVPLRFISENFGADVSYDNETERITVVKEKNGDSTISIEGSVNSKYIGDSYFGWSMENPLDMTMEYRDFNGMQTVFSDGENEIEIGVFTYEPEDFDFESDYNEAKMIASDFTLVKTEKNTKDKNCMSYHIGVKDKNDYYDYQLFATPEYIFTVDGMFSNSDTKVRDGYLALLATFACKFDKNDTYDLANNKDGYKKFESEHLKLSFNVPENFYMATSEDSQNQFEFREVKNEISSISAVVYSKSDVTSATALAAADYKHNKTVLNETLATFGEGTTERQYSNISATEYSYEVKSEKESYHVRDVFFEVGDYVYNISVCVELPSTNYDAYIDKIVESVKAEPLDSEEIGVLLRNVPEATGKTKVKIGKVSLEVPNIYIKMGADESSAVYMGSVNGVIISCTKSQSANITSTQDLKKLVKDVQEQLRANGAVIVNALSEKTINGQKFQTYRAKTTEDDETSYIEEYACIYKGSVYVITALCSEMMYSQHAQEEIKEVMASIKFES